MTAPVSYVPVATRDDTTRGDFVVKVYQHLLLAIAAFIGIETLLLNTPVAKGLYDFVATSGVAWLLILGGFMIISWLATLAAHDVLNPNRQYAGLFGLAAGEALIFAPFLYYFFYVQPNGASTVWQAAVL